MKKLSVAAVISVALSSIAVAPAAAQDAQVAIHYGDLDLATPAGTEVLGERIEAGVKAVCERPDIRVLKSMAAWEQCKDAALTSAAEQLARQGARVTLAAAN
jgi:UrcA family protein